MSPRPRRVKGGWQVWTVNPRTGEGKWVTEYDQRAKREACKKCHDTGRVLVGYHDANLDDPWPAALYEPCTCAAAAAERKAS